jgi:hypothetical protein
MRRPPRSRQRLTADPARAIKVKSKCPLGDIKPQKLHYNPALDTATPQFGYWLCACWFVMTAKNLSEPIALVLPQG